jgi:hypothetical protein
MVLNITGRFVRVRYNKNTTVTLKRYCVTLKRYCRIRLICQRIYWSCEKHVQNGYIYLELWRAVWGLPQATRILANKHLKQKLEPFGYHECKNTPGLWYHETKSITFTLVINNFGVKYFDKSDVEHLIESLKANYALTVDWTGNLYCGISLDWDYVNRWVDISMPGYIKKKMQEYGHVIPNRLQMCPYSPEPKKFGSKAQAPLPPDASPKLDEKGIKRIQQIFGSILYYACAVDMTVLAALSTIAINQTKATE